MAPEISDTCMFLTSAKDIWEALNQTTLKPKMLLEYMKSR